MLSLWANWLQLNSQLNSPGVSFWLYRRAMHAAQMFKRTLYSEKNMNSLNVEYFLAMNIQNLDKNG